MTIRDLFNHWEGPGHFVVHEGSTVLVVNGSAVPPDQTWFLRIVTATSDEREKLEEAGYVLKEAVPQAPGPPLYQERAWRPLVAGPGAFCRKRHPVQR